MAEFCKKCFKENTLDSKDLIKLRYGQLIIIKSKDKDICEGCGKYKRYVINTEDIISKETYNELFLIICEILFIDRIVDWCVDKIKKIDKMFNKKEKL